MQSTAIHVIGINIYKYTLIQTEHSNYMIAFSHFTVEMGQPQDIVGRLSEFYYKGLIINHLNDHS